MPATIYVATAMFYSIESIQTYSVDEIIEIGYPDAI